MLEQLLSNNSYLKKCFCENKKNQEMSDLIF